MALLKTQLNHWRTQTLPPKGDNSYPDWLANCFEVLQDKLKYATKSLTSWDFYKISDVVEQKEDFEAKWAKLLPNTGLIINSDSFNAGNDGFKRGDIAFKMEDLSRVVIKAENGGILYPKRINTNQSGNTYNLTYAFSPFSPAIGSSTEEAVDADADFASQITFTGLESPTITSIYGHCLTPEGNSIQFDKKTKSEIINQTVDTIEIKPLIKFFTSSNEEVYYDFVLGETGTDNSQFSIQKIPSLINKVVVK